MDNSLQNNENISSGSGPAPLPGQGNFSQGAGNAQNNGQNPVLQNQNIPQPPLVEQQRPQNPNVQPQMNNGGENNIQNSSAEILPEVDLTFKKPQSSHSKAPVQKDDVRGQPAQSSLPPQNSPLVYPPQGFMPYAPMNQGQMMYSQFPIVQNQNVSSVPPQQNITQTHERNVEEVEEVAEEVQNLPSAVEEVVPEKRPYTKPILQVDQSIALPQGADGSIDVIAVVNNIFYRAKQERASDIHVEPQEGRVMVRFRIDGEFHEYFQFPVELKQPILTRVMILAGLKIDESRLPQDGKILTVVNNVEIDMRVSTFPAMHGNKIVMRLLEKDAKAKTLESLGYGGRPLEIINKNLERTFGMVLMTGPTGSGKSTTLFSMLSSYDPFEFNISTLEDPIEYVVDGANQAQVKAEIGFDFADGLRSLVRQDPDIIMIGEIRDKTSANLAVQAALTGHLVFSTVHANTAAATVQRLANMGVDPFLAASALNLIVSQRLVRKICPDCRVEFRPPADDIKPLEEILTKESLKKMRFFKGKGCEKCRFTGYKGRISISEVLPITPGVQREIIKNPIASKIEAQAIKEGMETIAQSGIKKVAQGLTTLEEVLIAIDASKGEH